MTKRALSLLLLVLLSTPSVVNAFLLEGYAFTSYGKAEHANETESPAMFAHAIGTTLAFRALGPIGLGASADYRFYNQSDEPKNPYGNRTGKRFSLAPALTVIVGPIYFRYNLQIFGDYKLSNPTSTGDEIVYKSVLGHSFFVSIPLYPKIRIGAFYEMETFDKYELGSAEIDLSANNNELEFNKFGIFLATLF